MTACFLKSKAFFVCLKDFPLLLVKLVTDLHLPANAPLLVNRILTGISVKCGNISDKLLQIFLSALITLFQVRQTIHEAHVILVREKVLLEANSQSLGWMVTCDCLILSFLLLGHGKHDQ